MEMVQAQEGSNIKDHTSPATLARCKLTDLSIKPDERAERNHLSVSSSDVSDITPSQSLEITSSSPSEDGGVSSTQLSASFSFRRVEGLLNQGRAAEALETLHLTILSKSRDDPDVLCLQGRCLVALGQAARALACFAGALAIDSEHVMSLLGCASVYKDAGELEKALKHLEVAHEKLNCRPDGSAASYRGGESASVDGADVALCDEDLDGDVNLKGVSADICSSANRDEVRQHVAIALATVLTDLGTRRKLIGGCDWQQLYERALAVSPRYPQVHYNLGVAASESGEIDKAIELYKKTVELEPRYAEAWCNLGVLWKSQGRLHEAIDALERAYKLAPNVDIVTINLSMALNQYGTEKKSLGDSDSVICAYERALAVRPNNGEVLYNLGVAHAELGHLDKAEFMYKLAISVSGWAEAHNNLGVLHRERGNHEAALQCYERALSIRPSFPQALNNLAVMYTQQGRAMEALNLLQATLMENPTYAEAHNNLGVLQRDVGEPLAAIASYERCCELDPKNRNAGQNKLLALNYVYPGESELVCSAHAEWGRCFEKLHPPMKPLSRDEIDATPGRPLVVGYVSPDLFTHSVSYFAEAPISLHSLNRVAPIVYNVCLSPDEKTERLRRKVEKAGGRWRDVAQTSEKELANIIRADKVDILVELTGHTAHNRLETLAYRPAPIQITWIGYPNSTGMTRIDYRFTDAICDPQNTIQTFTEKLVRLPDCFLCYTPSQDAPDVAPLPALQNGFVTFGSFNALAKQTPSVLAVWCQLLKKVPNSRLILKNKPFACAATRQKYWDFFEAEGVSKDRVDLLPLARATKDHLGQYSLIDIALDPWPYAGTTTTAEALYMGVPCLTLLGRCHAHNVGASLLSAVGLGEEWMASSEEDYVDKAIKWAKDITSLTDIRKSLRNQMLESNLCNGDRFVSNLEDVYHRLWDSWLREEQEDSSGRTGGVIDTLRK